MNRNQRGRETGESEENSTNRERGERREGQKYEGDADSISLTLFLMEAWGKVREIGLQGAVDGMFSDVEKDVE